MPHHPDQASGIDTGTGPDVHGHGQPSPRRILVVDDEEMNRVIMAAQVRALGHMPLVAANGREALGLMSRGVHLVLMDVMMPGMNGFQVVKAIRGGRSCPDVPIIMVTALSDGEYRLQALEAGADDYLVKPFGRAELRDRIWVHLGLVARDADDSRRGADAPPFAPPGHEPEK